MDEQCELSQFSQNVIVMRHGDRLDNFVPLWAASSPRPWDPPLTEDGKIRAFGTGEKYRKQLSFPIHRVFVSPFLRCLQTATEVISSLCAVGNTSHDPNHSSSNGVRIDPSKIKVAVEFGLCEMMNPLAIRNSVMPKDSDFSFDLAECELVLPAGTIDKTAEMVYKELPRWPETVEGARSRYLEVINILADKHPTENLLIITHGEGVGAAVSRYYHHLMAYEVEYCAYLVSKRHVNVHENHLLAAGDFAGSPHGLFGIEITNAPTESVVESSIE